MATASLVTKDASHSSNVPPPVLLDAINAATITRLRTQTQSEEEGDDDDDEDDDDDNVQFIAARAVGSKAGSKRKSTFTQQRFEVCVQCKEEYSQLTRMPNTALVRVLEHIYRPDLMDIDYHHRLWADHDERCHGPVNSSANRRNDPEGFIWQCYEEGCETGPHVPGGSLGKKC